MKLMRCVLLPAVSMLLCSALVLGGTAAVLSSTMPPFRDSVGDHNDTEKITGEYLVELSAAQDDTLLIFGSSELRTTYIPTHPANFFAGKRAGFQVDLIGRGSCQSLIHAIELAASGDSLRGEKMVLITSPQSFVPEGIAPDLFMANFSAQQYLDLLNDPELSDEVKQYLSGRIAELLAAYRELPDAAEVDPAIQVLAAHEQSPSLLSSAADFILTPYYELCSFLYDLRDMAVSRPILQRGVDASPSDSSAKIDWAQEEQQATQDGIEMSSNNDFGMNNDYYTTYIGSRLERQQGSEANLSYSESVEYDDLRILFQICNEKGIEPLFVHVPMHGQWSDYTGFTADRRQQYYENVRQIAGEYGIQMLDLTGYEYEPYFMCDVMHLGWKGWLQVDRALIDYYYAD